jgi:acyl carrier protein
LKNVAATEESRGNVDILRLIKRIVSDNYGIMIGDRTNFADAGIDSLSIFSLIAALSEELDMVVTSATISENPCAIDLARALKARQPALFLPLERQQNGISSGNHVASTLPRWYLAIVFISSLLCSVAALVMRWTSKQRKFLRVRPVHKRKDAVRGGELQLSNYDSMLMSYHMTHVLFFPEGADEHKLGDSLAVALDAFPSFASTLTLKDGRICVKWDDSTCVPFGVSKSSTPLLRDNFPKGSLQHHGQQRVSAFAWFCASRLSLVLQAMVFAWKRANKSPLLELELIHLCENTQHCQNGSAGRTDTPASPGSSWDSATEEPEGFAGSSYLCVRWSHALCDGPTMMKFLDYWSQASRGQELLMPHDGPAEPWKTSSTEPSLGSSSTTDRC